VEGDELTHFRRVLRERRQALLDEGDVPIERIRKDPSEVGGDEDEQPLTEMSQALASSRNRARAAELKQVEEAIARLEADPDMFGLCSTCEEPIARRRLEAMPHARMCVACQSVVEDPVKRGPRKKLTDFV
jgi:DnaK suppressor protein